MKRAARFFLVFFTLVAFSSGLLFAQALLNGKTFAGEMGENGQMKGDADEFIFKDGEFRSTACDKYGFGNAPYTAIPNEGVTVFDAKTQSPTEGMMKWHGEVKNGLLEGFAIWTKPGDAAAKEYWFKGEQKK